MIDASIQLLVDGTPVLEQPVGEGLAVGRDPVCGLIVSDWRVSALHAQFDLRGGRLFVTDLGSRNGTSLGGRPVVGTRAIKDGDEVVLADVVRLRVHMPVGAGTGGIVVFDRVLGIAIAVDRPRVIEVSELGELVVALTRDGDGVRWRLGDEAGVARVGESLGIAPDRLVVSLARRSLRQTMDAGLLPYRIRGRLVADEGAVVEVGRLSGPALAQVRGTLPAMLIYILALARDEDGDVPESGWRPDDALRAALWGNQQDNYVRNAYNMVVSRARQVFAEAGLDSTCIEKRKGWTRVTVARVELEAGGLEGP